MDGAYAARAIERRRTMIARVARSREDVPALERERDASMSPTERVEAIRHLGCELHATGGGDPAELRLDRTVARVERRKR